MAIQQICTKINVSSSLTLECVQIQPFIFYNIKHDRFFPILLKTEPDFHLNSDDELQCNITATKYSASAFASQLIGVFSHLNHPTIIKKKNGRDF